MPLSVRDNRSATPMAILAKAGLEATYPLEQVVTGCPQISLRGPEKFIARMVLFSLWHVEGQWYASKQSQPVGGASAPPDAALRAAVRYAATFTRGLSSEVLHGLLWHLLLRRARLLDASGERFDIATFVEQHCCAACQGSGCNSACTSTSEGDFYHHCFHGVGHGLALLELGRATPAALDTYSPCSAAQPLSLSAHPEALSSAEAACALLTKRWRANRRFCYTGVYMHYFQLLAPVESEWAAACEHALCRASCIIKCREFGSFLFPATGTCYGVAAPPSTERVRQLDARFGYASADEGNSFYTLETEALLVAEGDAGGGCFS